MQHCMAYIESVYDERRYRAYITDALMALTENTARYAGGRIMGKRWRDVYKPIDTRSGDEIAAAVIMGAGLRVKDGE